MLIIGVLLAIAVPRYATAIRAAKESVLKEDLHVMRQAIDSYTMDKQKAPQSLQDLVDGGYLKSIPVDPMSQSSESWVVNQSDTLSSIDQSEPGIDDVHSSSDQPSIEGKPYSSW